MRHRRMVDRGGAREAVLVRLVNLIEFKNKTVSRWFFKTKRNKREKTDAHRFTRLFRYCIANHCEAIESPFFYNLQCEHKPLHARLQNLKYG